MVLIMTLALSATVGMAYAVRAAATKEVREVLYSPTPGEKAMEVKKLSEAMVNDLTRMLKKGGPHNSEDVERIHRGVLALLVSTWTRGGFYWNDAVVPFFNVYDSTAKIEGSAPSNEYLRLLKNTITELTPQCCSLILKQDGGERVNMPNARASILLTTLSREIDRHFQRKVMTTTRNGA